jgi:vacuolar-type H+-ATPase subunit E/Vma4
MALDQLLTVLRLEAEAESAAALAAARAEAQIIRDRAAAEIARRQDGESSRWEAERQHAMAVTLAGARRAAREQELLARDRLLDRVLTRARRQLPAALTRAEFRESLPALLAQAQECLGDRTGEIRYSPPLGDEMVRLTGDRKEIELRADPAIGTGFRLVSSDGSLAIDATLEQRADQLGPRLRQEILARLEGVP